VFAPHTQAKAAIANHMEQFQKVSAPNMTPVNPFAPRLQQILKFEQTYLLA
jgi:hypothetical protein